MEAQRVSKTLKWTYVIALAALLFSVYGSSLNNEFVRWDDGLLIYENPAVWSVTPENLVTIFTTYDPELYIPLTLFSYQIDYMISGTKAGFYHLHSFVLHLLNSLCVTWLAWLLSKRPWVAAICGIGFAIHPLNVEAVAWASGRKDVLSTLWVLLSACLYLKWHENGQRSFFGLSLGAFLLALLSKVTVAVLPILLLLIDWRRDGKVTAAMIKEKLPYFALSFIFGIVALGGKQAVIESTSTLEKLMMAPQSAVFYLQKFILPTKLAVLYPVTGEISALSPRFLIPLALLMALIALTALSLKRTREVAFGFGFFFTAILVALFHFSKGDFLYFASDRYAYLPLIGLLWITAVGIDELRRRTGQKGAITVVCCFVGVIMAYATHRQSLTWADTETLFLHNVRHYPESVVAHNNLGNYYLQRSDLENSRTHYEEARRLLEEELPETPSTPRALSKVLANVATAHVREGEIDSARRLIERAIELHPNNAEAHLSLGILHARNGEVNSAETAYAKALELKPGFATAYINLGALYAGVNRYGEALQHYEKAIDINPFYAHAHFNEGVAHGYLSQTRQAIEAYERAVDLQPTFTAARINLGILYANRGNIDGAVEQFRAVLRIDPQNARARNALNQLGG